MDNTLQLEAMKTRIEGLDREHHIKTLKLLHADPNVKINENKSGCYVNLSFYRKRSLNRCNHIWITYMTKSKCC